MRKHDLAESVEQRIGPEVKRLREHAGLSVRTLAERAGFSASFISQLENGLVSPSIASLENIAKALGVSIVSFFTPPPEPSPRVVRADARPTFKSSWSKAQVSLLTPRQSSDVLEALMVNVERGGSSGKHVSSLQTEQLVVVFAGTIELTVGDEPVVLACGDSVIVPAGTPHRWHNPGPSPAEILLVTSSVKP